MTGIFCFIHARDWEKKQLNQSVGPDTEAYYNTCSLFASSLEKNKKPRGLNVHLSTIARTENLTYAI